MRLKILLSILPVLLLVFSVGNFAIFAAPVLNSTNSDGVISTSTESVISKQEDPIQVLGYLRQTYPKFQFDSVSQLSEIPALYEIIAGTNVFYYANGYLIFGEILDSSGNSITDRKRNALTVSKVKDIPLEKAVKIGQGKNKVIEFTDVDCPFCKKAAQFFSKRTDVTRYIFFFPLEDIHPNAKKKSLYILCSKDKEKAYKDVMDGSVINVDLPSDCNKKLIDEHIFIGKKIGVSGVPFIYINGYFVNGFDEELVKKLLEKGGE